MTVRILAPAVIAALLTTGALAPATFAQSGDGDAPANGNAAQASQSVNGYVIASPEQVLASGIIGQTVYNSAGEDGETVGDINDVVMSTDGAATALVIGVGGFLGIGEKEVALDFSNVSVVRQDGETILTTAATRADLEAAPSFERAALEREPAPETEQAPAADLQPEGEAPAADDAETQTAPEPQTDSDVEAEAEADVEAEGNTESPASAPGADEASGEIVPLTQLSAQELMGARVYSAEGRDIGEINDVLLNQDSAIQTYLVDVGGFLGIGEKQVALAADDLTVRRTLDGWLTVETSFTQEQLEAHPAYSEEAYSEEPETVTLN